MDYEPEDIIDVSVDHIKNIYRFIYLGHAYTGIPAEYKEYGWHWEHCECPDCGAHDSNAFELSHPVAKIGFLCNICKIMWYEKIGVSCIECGRPLYTKDGIILTCDWCGQQWDLEVIRDSYLLGDHDSQIDWSIPKGANLQ